MEVFEMSLGMCETRAEVMKKDGGEDGVGGMEWQNF